MDPKQLEVLEKIKKLMRLADHPNTLPEEAASAAAKAQELMLRYKLDTASLDTPDEAEAKDEPVLHYDHHDPIYAGAQFSTWKYRLVSCLAKHNNCVSVVCRSLWRERGCTVRFQLIGRVSDVELVRWMYHHILPQVERLCTNWLQAQLSYNRGRAAATQFRLGVIQTINQRLTEMNQEVRQEYVDANKGSALAIIDKAKAKTLETYTQISKAEKWRSGSSWHLQGNGSARAAGQAAGRQVSLNRQVAVGSKARGYLN